MGGRRNEASGGPPQGPPPNHNNTLRPPPVNGSHRYDGSGEHGQNSGPSTPNAPLGRQNFGQSPRSNMGQSPQQGQQRQNIAAVFSGPMSDQPPRQNPFGPGLGFDPAKPVIKERVITNTRVDWGPSVYGLDDGGRPSELPARPGYNSTGKTVTIRLNQFKVTKWPERDIHQYDILIGNGAEKKGKVMAIWKSMTAQNKLRAAAGQNNPWIWDGNKIAWNSANVGELRFSVDLDAEKGRVRDQPQLVHVIIRPVTVIRMAVLGAFLNKQVPWTNDILAGINFLDHVMRQYPSENYATVKRSFFSRTAAPTPLDSVIVALKGVYTSIRLCDPKSSVGSPSTGLALNVDVANGTFWAAQGVMDAARLFVGGRSRNDALGFRDALLPVDHANGLTMSPAFKHLRRMCKLRFYIKHASKEANSKEYIIKNFVFKQTKDGSNTKNTTFEMKARNGKPAKTISIYDYYKEAYNIKLTHWYLPLIETTRNGLFPMELARLVPLQRYNFKLGPEQTQAMIRFAVTRPRERLTSIQNGINMLNWKNDPYLNHFGVQIDTNMTLTSARILPNPEVQYDRAKVNPGTSGRWDLRGKKFLFSNPEPLKSWGFCVLEASMSEPEVRNFINVFMSTYIGHGGKVDNKNPKIIIGARGEDTGNLAARARSEVGNHCQALPQIIFWVMPARDSFVYERLKKNMECRFAMVSQMMNISHVRKAQPQYCSNVCMKVNAKLGGTSCKVANAKSWFPRPTMVIGADVSHPGPGSPQASMAALTMSFDTNACRFAAAVETNGIRVEMITKANFQTMMIPLFKQWVKKVGNGQGPVHIYYYRDGVSEGQYAAVLKDEVGSMRDLLTENYGPNGANIKFTVVICAKRHHIRMFPKDGDAAGDKNGNPLPGTLVEKDVTHPFDNDFYLNSHSAIQGTARPTHYYVIKDEANVPINELHKMTYQFCYQYMRSTTPVSLFPAVYYAHLASNRARAHEDAAASSGPRGGQKFDEIRAQQARQGGNSSNTGSSIPIEAKALVPMGNPESKDGSVERIRTSMWYI